MSKCGKPSVGAQTEGVPPVNSGGREPALNPERVRAILAPFVNLRDQNPSETAKIIHKELSGLTPIALTVTKDQFLEAWLLWNALS